MPRLSMTLLITVMLIAGCASSEGGHDETSTTTIVVATTQAPVSTSGTQATTTTVTATTTTTLPPLDPPETLFSMTRVEILEASAPVMETAGAIADALELGDRELLVSAFASGGYVIDLVVPSLRPRIRGWFDIFRKLCGGSEASNLHVNVSGAAWRGSCSGFYEGLVSDPPPTVWFLPHVLMADAMGVVMLNRMEAEVAAAYPAETSDAIGFQPSREKNVTWMAEAAVRFIPVFEAAWESGHVEAIAALYADDGVRIDGFAGLAEDPRATRAWIEAFVRDYGEVSVEIELLVASAPGPGAVYTVTLGVEGDSCVMQMVSAWELDEHDHIVREYVYYHPDTVLDCGWEAPEE